VNIGVNNLLGKKFNYQDTNPESPLFYPIPSPKIEVSDSPR